VKALLVILALAMPAFADHTARASAGVGLGRHEGPLKKAYVEHYAIGARATDRDWITASFDRLWGDDTDDLSAHDERLWELSIAASRMTCSSSTWWLCGVYGAGAGYQSAGKTEIDDIPINPAPDVEYDLDNLFVEARVAARVNFSYAWLELWVALRVHAQLDRSSPGDNIDSDPTVGLMLSITP